MLGWAKLHHAKLRLWGFTVWLLIISPQTRSPEVLSHWVLVYCCTRSPGEILETAQNCEREAAFGGGKVTPQQLELLRSAEPALCREHQGGLLNAGQAPLFTYKYDNVGLSEASSHKAASPGQSCVTRMDDSSQSASVFSKPSCIGTPQKLCWASPLKWMHWRLLRKDELEVQAYLQDKRIDVQTGPCSFSVQELHIPCLTNWHQAPLFSWASLHRIKLPHRTKRCHANGWLLRKVVQFFQNFAALEWFKVPTLALQNLWSASHTSTTGTVEKGWATPLSGKPGLAEH